jgi:hypothetical protein
MNYMFSNTIFNQNIINWDTTNIIRMDGMFSNASNFNQPIGNWITNNVKTFSNMFKNAVAFNKYIGNWNTSNVTNMEYMFYGESGKVMTFNQDIGSWNTSNVTSMKYMFGTTPFNQNIGNWNIRGIDGSGFNFFMIAGMTVANFDNLLNGWVAQNVQNKYLDATNIQYSTNGQTSFNTLVNSYRWTINSGGLTNKTVPILSNFNVPSNVKYGDSPYTVAAPSTNNNESGGTITYTSSDTTIATVSTSGGNVVITIIGAGIVYITATQAETTSFVKNSISVKMNVSAMSMYFAISTINTTVSIPLSSSVGLNVHWGDGISNTSLTHTYSNLGAYNVILGSTATNLTLGQLSDTWTTPVSLRQFTSYGSVNIASIAYAFTDCSAMVYVVLPNTISTIGNNAFQNCSALTTITIPSNFANIGDFAFNNCTSLSNINIPTSITNIGNSAFYNCTNLLYIKIPGTVKNTISSFLTNNNGLSVSPSGLNYIDTNNITYDISNNQASVIAYSGTSTSILLPININTNNTNYPITSISGNVFNTKNLTSVLIPPFITSIGNDSFKNNLLTDINLPQGITFIGTSCFQTNNISSLFLPNIITSLSDNVFSSNKLNSISIPSQITSAGIYAFANNNITSITSTGQITSISDYTFYNNKLTYIDLSNSSIVSIGNYSYAVNNLTQVLIPFAITSIGNYTFYNNKLSSLDLSNTNLFSIGDYTYSINSLKQLTIPSRITTIGTASFQSNNLTSVNFQASVSSLTESLFADNSLNNFTIPSTISYIDNNALKNNNLTSIVIPSSVSSIGSYAFYNNILTPTAAPFQTSIFNIGYAAFYNNSANVLNNNIDSSGITYGSFSTDSSGSYIAQVSGYNTSSTVVIPFTVVNNGIKYNVVSIAGNTFLNKSISTININMNINYIGNYACASNNLVSVLLPNTITSVGIHAFANNSLTTVNIPNQITSIGDYVFSNNKLTNVDLSNSNVVSLGNYAYSTNNLTNVNVPNKIISIGQGVFQRNSLTSVLFQSPVSSLTDYLFANNNLTNITLPYSVTNIGNYTFNNNKLSYIDLSNSNIVSLGNYAYSINKLTQIAIPSQITSIGQGVFQSNNLTALTIESPVSTIPDNIFSDNSLNSYAIPSNIKIIGNSSFKNNNLTSIEIPTSVTSIGSYAFYNNVLTPSVAPFQTSISSIGYAAFYNNSANVLNNNIDSSGITYSSFSTDSSGSYIAQTTSYVGTSNVVIPFTVVNNGIKYNVVSIAGNTFLNKSISTMNINMNINYIGNYACASNNLVSVLLPNTITSVGIHTFANNSLTNANIPNKITSIGDYVFNNNKLSYADLSNIVSLGNYTYSNNNLTNVNLPSTVTSIGQYVFSNNKLTNIDLSNIVSLGNYAYSINNLTQIVIPSKITSIGQGVFQSNSLTSVLFQSPVSTLNDYLFANNLLTSITLPYSVTNVGNYVFYNNKLSSVDLTNSGIITIGTYAYAMNELTQLLIPSRITVLNDYVFSNNKINSIIIPSSIVSIGKGAFQYNNLSTISIPQQVKILNDYVLANNELNSISIPPAITNIGNSALQNNFLTNISFPFNLTYIGKSALQNNTLQTPITIPLSVSFVGDNAFSYNQLANTIDISHNSLITFAGNGLSTTITVGLNILSNNGATNDKKVYVKYSYGKKWASPTLTLVRNRIPSSSFFDLSNSNIVLVIGKLIIHPFVATNDKSYDGKTTATGIFTLTGVISPDDVKLSGNANFVDKIAGINKTVNITNLNLFGVDSIYYDLSVKTTNTIANIYKIVATPIITANSKIYDTTNIGTFSYTLYGVISGDVVDLSGSTFFIDYSVGTNKTVNISDLVLTNTDSVNYDLPFDKYISSANINKAFIYFSIPNKNYDNTTRIYNYNIIGVYPIDASDVFVSASINFTSAKIGNNITVSTNNVLLYGEKSVNYDILYLNNPPLNPSLSRLTGNIVQKTLFISGTYTKVYDGTNTYTKTLNLDGVNSGDIVELNYSNIIYDLSNVNATKVSIFDISLNGRDAFNYSIARNIDFSATITKKPIDISAVFVKQYDKTNEAFTSAIDLRGVIPTDASLVNVSYSSANYTNYEVGNHNVILNGVLLNGPQSFNYSINKIISIIGTINQKILDVSATVISKIYDNTNTMDFIVDLSGVLQGELINSVGTGTTKSANAGSYSYPNDISFNNSNIILFGIQSQNYTLAPTSNIVVNNQAVIQKKPLTLSGTAQDKMYDATTNVNTALNLSGIFNFDIVDISSGYISNFRSPNAGTNVFVDVSNIILYGKDSNNYTVSPTLSLRASISKKRVDVSSGTVIKEYDKTRFANNALVLTIIGAVDNNVKPNYLNALYDNPFIGKSKQVSITGITLFGNTASNYILNSNTLIVDGIITIRTLNLDVQGVNKVYDTNINAQITYNLVGKLTGDDIDITYSPPFFDNASAGNNKNINIYDISLYGVDAVNYTISKSATTTASITPFFVDNYINGFVDTKRYNPYYPTDVTATVNLYLNLPSLYQFDDITVNYTSANFPLRNPPYDDSNKLNVSITGLYLSGSNMYDYSLNTAFLNLPGLYSSVSSIKILQLFVADESINKTYDRRKDIPINFIAKDDMGIIPYDLSINYIQARFNDINVGIDKLIYINGIYLSGANAVNYYIDNSFSTTGNIFAKQLDLSKNIVRKVYDASAYLNNTKFDLSGVYFGDNIYAIGNVNFYTASAGLKSVVTAYNLNVSGDINNNYTLPYTSIDLSGIISKKPLSLSISKTYDKTNTVNFYDNVLLNGIVGTDVVKANALGLYSQFTPGNITANLNNIQLSGVDSANYDISATINNVPATINKKILDVIVVKTYDSSNVINNSNIALNGILLNDSVSFVGSGIFGNTYVGNNVPATLFGNLVGNARNNYAINTNNLIGRINPKPIPVFVFPVTYNGSNIASVNNFSITNSLFTSDANKVRLIKSPSSYTFFYDSSQAGNRYITNATGSLFLDGELAYNYTISNLGKIDASINRRVIDFSNITKIYDKTLDISASNIILTNAVSGDNVNFNYSELYTNAINVGTGYVFIKNINLYGYSTNNYILSRSNIIDSSTYRISLTIVPRLLNIEITPRMYDATNVVYTNDIILNNYISTDDVGFTTNATYNNANVGNKTVYLRNTTLTGFTSYNYSILANVDLSSTILKRELGVTILPRIYNGTTIVNLTDVSLNNVIGVDERNISIKGNGTYNSKNIGNRIVRFLDFSLNGNASPNYNISPILTLNGIIEPLTPLFALNAKTYDSTNSLNINYVYIQNKIPIDDVTISGIGFYDAAFVGSRKANINNIVLTGQDSGNYIANTSVQIDASIIPYPLSITASDKIYDGTTIAPNLSLKNIAKYTIGIYPSDVGKVFVNGYLRFIDSIVDVNKIILVANNLQNVYLSGDASMNYTIYNDEYITANIYPKYVSIVPTIIPKIYDSYTTATATLDISGLIASEYGLYSANYGSANYINAIVGNSKSVSVKFITVDGPYPQNYIYDTSLIALGNITKKPIGINATVNTKTYDKKIDASVNLQVSGILHNDNVYITGDASFNDASAGYNKPVYISNFSLYGSGSNNYITNYDYILTVNGNITPRSVAPYVINISNKTYDTFTNATGSIGLTGILENDDVSVDGLFTFRNSDASTNKIVDVKNINLYGPDASNYLLPTKSLTGNSNIYPLQLSILPYTKMYDGTTFVDISDIKITGMLNNEKIRIRGNALFDLSFVGTNVIYIKDAYLYGDISNNYSILPTQSITGIITSKPFFRTIQDKIYDKTDTINIVNASVSGLVNTDTIYISYIDAIYSNNGNRGTKIKININDILFSGDSMVNYELSGIDTIYANILPRPIFAEATVNDKSYDGYKTANINIKITTGLLENDNANIISYNAEFDTSEPGKDKIVYINNIQLDNNNYYVSDFTTTGNIYTTPGLTSKQISNTSVNIFNKSNPQVANTNPNVSTSMLYSNLVNRNSYNL